MRELEFIDSTGIALLVAALAATTARRRSASSPATRPAVTRVLELTGLSERLPLAEA